MDVAPAAPDDDAELQLPIGLRGRRWQHQIVERTDDRRRRFQERVRLAIGGALVHHLLRPLAEFVAAQTFRPDVLVDREVDHVLAVVGPGEEQLARKSTGACMASHHRHALVEGRLRRHVAPFGVASQSCSSARTDEALSSRTTRSSRTRAGNRHAIVRRERTQGEGHDAGIGSHRQAGRGREGCC